MRRTVIQVNTHPVPGSVRVALISLYGAVAAVVRGDRPAVRLMVSDLTEALDGIEEVLIVISLASLECLGGALGSDVPQDEPGTEAVDSAAAAREMLAIASRFGMAHPEHINSAAWRLDAVRSCDRTRAAADIAQSRQFGSELELVNGAIALLSAIVARQAVRSGRSPQRHATEICLAAALAAS